MVGRVDPIDALTTASSGLAAFAGSNEAKWSDGRLRDGRAGCRGRSLKSPTFTVQFAQLDFEFAYWYVFFVQKNKISFFTTVIAFFKKEKRLFLTTHFIKHSSLRLQCRWMETCNSNILVSFTWNTRIFSYRKKVAEYLSSEWDKAKCWKAKIVKDRLQQQNIIIELELSPYCWLHNMYILHMFLYYEYLI